MTLKDTKRPNIVVWGADNYNTLGVIRSVSVEDVDLTLIVIGRKHKVASASKYCQKCIVTHNVEEGVNYMIKHFPEQTDPKKKAVLIPGGDGASKGIAENHDVLKKRFHLMCTTDPAILLKTTDKTEMSKVARSAGLLVPEDQEFHVGVTEIKVPFPVILKPVYVEGRVEFKTKIIHDRHELDSFVKMLNPNNRYLIQQYIEKSHDIVIYGCRLADGTLKLAGHHTLERWSDDGGGSYGHLYPDIPDYLRPEALKKFFEMIDYYGEFSAEYGYKDGKAYFYEVNLRNDGFCHLSFQAGANLPLLWVQSCLGQPLTASDKMTKSGVAINEVYDVINAWRGVISWKRFRADKKEAIAYHFYDPNDMQPYKNMHRRMFWEIPFRAILKTYRPLIVKSLRKLGI